MNKLPAGGNISLNTQELEVFVNWTPENAKLDICAFALGANHKVRSDDDFICDNYSSHKEGFIDLSNEQFLQQCLHINLAKIPAGVEKIVIVATATENLTFLNNLNIEVKGLASFTPILEAVQSLVLGEFYLNKGQWKFKAIGQGFKEGLEFITNYYGVNLNNLKPEKKESTSTPSKQQQLQTTTKPVVIDTTTTTINPPEVIDAVVERIPRPPENQHLNALQTTIKMAKELSWTWVLLSFVLFIAIELFLGGFVGGMVLGRFVPHILVYQIEVLLVLASFFIGGVIIGFVSPAIRILEPALAAFFSVLLTLSISVFSPYRFMSFTWTKVIIGGGIAFALAFFGAHLGEKLSAKMGNKTSRKFFGDENSK
jgi:stress response protein SCP2